MKLIPKEILEFYAITSYSSAFGRDASPFAGLNLNNLANIKAIFKEKLIELVVNNFESFYKSSFDIYDFLKKFNHEISILFNNITRINCINFGHTQKYINLIIKHLVFARYIPKSYAHCPIDSFIIHKTQVNICWSRMKFVDYCNAINDIKKLAKKDNKNSIFDWEDEMWRKK